MKKRGTYRKGLAGALAGVMLISSLWHLGSVQAEGLAEMEIFTEPETPAESESSSQPGEPMDPVIPTEGMGEEPGAAVDTGDVVVIEEIYYAAPGLTDGESYPGFSDAVKMVQEMLDALPTAEELEAMTVEEQKKTYDRVQAAYDAYEALTEEEKALVQGAERFEELFGVFNGMTELLENNTGSFEVTGGESGDAWTYDSTANTLTFTKSGTYTVEGNGTKVQDRIIIAGDNLAITLTLKNVNIDVSGKDKQQALYGKAYAQSNVQLHIILEGQNRLVSSSGEAGLAWYNDDDASSLTIEGSGSLEALGGYRAAGIGNCWNRRGTKNITISGGTVTATGGEDAAGIGGGEMSPAENITIRGGTIIATGRNLAAGIGGGNGGYGKNITISGGTVTATAGDWDGAGIGGGFGASGENITITGGTVTATGGWGGAGIGGGEGASGGNIIIGGGTVTATAGGGGGAGIGSGNNGTSGTFSTGDGNAFINASSIGDKSNIENWSGVIFGGEEDKNTGKVYGNPELKTDATIPGDKTLEIDNDTTLTIDGGVTLTNYGTIINDGTITNYGTIKNYGTIIGTVSGNPPVNYKSPAPSITESNIQKTASTLKVTGTFDTNIYGNLEYNWDNSGWTSNDELSGLKANSSHTVSIRYAGKEDYRQSDASNVLDVLTNNASYTITIPSNATAGEEAVNIAVRTESTDKFELGHNGQVDVKISGGVENGKVILTRQSDPKNSTITSEVLIGEEPTPLGERNIVASFTMANRDPVPVSFAQPQSATEIIPAGTYEGSVTFEVSYSEQ